MPNMHTLVFLFALMLPACPSIDTIKHWLRPPVTHIASLQALWLQNEFGIAAKTIRRQRIELLLAALH